MRMFKTDSSLLHEMGYANGTLQVRFSNGSLYRYFNVPVKLWDAMQAADSMGSFFCKHIRMGFEYERMQ